jgi:hypothetical protein
LLRRSSYTEKEGFTCRFFSLLRLRTRSEDTLFSKINLSS